MLVPVVLLKSEEEPLAVLLVPVVAWILAPQFAPDGSVAHVISTNRDITERILAEDALRVAATHDSLTGHRSEPDRHVGPDVQRHLVEVGADEQAVVAGVPLVGEEVVPRALREPHRLRADLPRALARPRDGRHEELLAEIERIESGNQDGATVTELVEQTGRSRPVILSRLKVAAKEGRLIVGRKVIHSIDGRPLWAPCYKIVKRQTAKGRVCPSRAKRKPR